MWGCDGFNSPQKFEYDESILLDKCPLKMITAKSNLYLRAYDLYSKGFLPNGKSWLQESFKFINIMQFIDSKYSEMKQRKNKNG